MRLSKGQYKFSKRELWNLDVALGPVIADGLEQFKKYNTHGYPAVFSNEDDGPDFEGRLGGGQEAWHATIDKMIYAFRNKEPRIPDNLFNHDCLKDGEFKIMINDQAAYDRFREEEKEHEERVTEGIQLFAKHYRNLWD